MLGAAEGSSTFPESAVSELLWFDSQGGVSISLMLYL